MSMNGTYINSQMCDEIDGYPLDNSNRMLTDVAFKAMEYTHKNNSKEAYIQDILKVSEVLEVLL